MIPFVILTIESEDDRAYMTLIYQRNRALMLKIAWEFTREKEDVEDVVSDSCVALINHLDDLRTLPEEAQRRYIAAVTRSRAIDFCRRRHRENLLHMPVDDGYMQRLPDDESIEKKVLLLEELRQIRALLHTLPAREQDILRMKYHQGMKHKEIAQELGIAESTVTTHLLRARSRLKAALY